ncbi:MAG: hypothetical protein HYZ34_00165 [Ignavibacteriae bacterium]|nr:hypothetical protein [Ignavibacteriota bacterium]
MSNFHTPLNLQITKLGIVSRDYRHKYENGYRDFSFSLPKILQLLDEKGCDAILFSLYTMIPRKDYSLVDAFSELKNIKALFIEEFIDGYDRDVKRFVVYYKELNIWKEYVLHQRFATLTGMNENDISSFVTYEMPKRMIGNCFVLLCGESNGVRYSKNDKEIQDIYGFENAIPKKVSIVLNPVHDRMTRFEMNLKREFLSKNNRWVVSVWNKGKQDKNGRIKDGTDPAWTVFYNGQRQFIEPIVNNYKLEIGILDTSK